MAVSIRHIAPVAHLPLVLGVLRKLEVAQLIDALIPPNPAQVLSNGRGVEALVLAMRDGHHALYKGGRRLDERGRVIRTPPRLPSMEPMQRSPKPLPPPARPLGIAKLAGVTSSRCS
jgi:Domain of unknown function (DUF4277)